MTDAKATFRHYRPKTLIDSRKAECRRISNLMSERRPFSFLRLGDMELMFLISCQQGGTVYWDPKLSSEASTVSSTYVFGHPGLSLEHAPRLQSAYEHCSYLDFHDGWKTNQSELPKWKFNRDPDLYRNPEPEVSQLFFDWLYYEFNNYIGGRRCLFAGAEAGLLKELYNDEIYIHAAKNYWPANAEPFFLPELRRISGNLDSIKSNLSDFIRKNKIDTAFISLGGASKILCYELAEENNIVTFDFGSLTRGLTYSGSDGHNFFRTTHYPFYFRVPFATYMNALNRSSPGLPPEKILAKAHAQLALELIRKEEGWSYASEWGGDDCLDLSEPNLRNFWESYEVYRREYFPLGATNNEARRQVQEFENWRKGLGIGLDGKIQRLVLRAKTAARKLIGA